MLGMALTSASCCWYISSSCLRPVRPSCLDATASCTAPEVKALHTHQPTMTSNMGALNFAVPEAHMHKWCNDLSHDDLEYQLNNAHMQGVRTPFTVKPVSAASPASYACTCLSPACPGRLRIQRCNAARLSGRSACWRPEPVHTAATGARL